MSKASSEELLKAVADDFHTFLRRGVRFEQVIGSAHTDLDIDDVETLLRIHFILTESDEEGEVGVLDFMHQLENQVRKMKTTTAPQSHEYRGEARGRIDWQQTVKSRARKGRLEEPVFVCSEPEEHYNIDENLVLMRLLTVIYEIVTDDLSYAVENPEGYEWLSAWTSPINESNRSVESMSDVLQRVYDRNIYLQRVNIDENTVTDRTIESVKRSRSPFYREAAELLDRYRRLMRHELDAHEAREILNRTLIAPDKPETLFELYWIFSILNTYDEAQYRVLSDWRKSPSTIARWEQGESLFVMSHDSTGEELRFHEEMESQDIDSDGYLFRLKEVLTRWQSLSEELLNRSGNNSLWGGRPDIVLERFEKSTHDEWVLEDIFIGEVKYTQDINYVSTGLRELLEYMAFVKHSDGNYVEGKDSVLESVCVKGMLFTDELGSEVSPNTGEGIRIVEYPDSVEDLLV